MAKVIGRRIANSVKLMKWRGWRAESGWDYVADSSPKYKRGNDLRRLIAVEVNIKFTLAIISCCHTQCAAIVTGKKTS
jgi:hypothetical protein